jgi:hypothetical protein
MISCLCSPVLVLVVRIIHDNYPIEHPPCHPSNSYHRTHFCHHCHSLRHNCSHRHELLTIIDHCSLLSREMKDIVQCSASLPFRMGDSRALIDLDV